MAIHICPSHSIGHLVASTNSKLSKLTGVTVLKTIMVIGAAHLSVTCRITDTTTVCKESTMEIAFGETVHDVSKALVKNGIHCKLVTKSTNSPLYRALQKSTEDIGVETMLDVSEAYPLPGVIVEEALDGTIISVTESESMAHASIPLDSIVKLMSGVNGILIEGTLASHTIIRVLEQAALRQIPVWIIAKNGPELVRLSHIPGVKAAIFTTRTVIDYLHKKISYLMEAPDSGISLLASAPLIVFDKGEIKATNGTSSQLIKIPHTQGSKTGWCLGTIAKILKEMLGGVALNTVLNNLAQNSELIYSEKSDTSLDQIISTIYQAANTDFLTGILNRRGLDLELNSRTMQALLRKGQVSVITLDIDHFKKINDKFGHDMGDEVLKWFSKLLTKMLRTNDILARTGGEEFVIVLPGETQSSAVLIAERLRAGVEAESKLATHLPTNFTISIGVAVHQPADSYTQTVKRADEALYLAKSTGRNKVGLAPAVKPPSTTEINVLRATD